MDNVFVKVEQLQPEARWIDTRFDLANADWGQQQYLEGHVSGAVYWHLERDLSNMASQEGRHPMPTHAQLQTLFEASGLRLSDVIYIYDQGAAPFATRAWYLLKYAGFNNVFVVNGGLSALQAAQWPFTNELTTVTPSTLTLQWQEARYASCADVEAIVNGTQQAVLLDARANARYKGEVEPIDPVAGHIPTAKNFDWEQLKVGNELIIPSALGEKVSKQEKIVVYCGSGVTASPLYATLVAAGYEDVRLYMGSYSDWIREHAVETGENN